MKKYIPIAIILVILLAGAFVAQRVLLGGISTTSLKKGPKLGGIVSQSLFTGNGSTTLPVDGTDYSITGSYSFYNGSWYVVRIKPGSNNELDGGTVVLQKVQNYYKVVLGPGSAFPSTALQGLPSDVSLYLSDSGAVYEPSAE